MFLANRRHRRMIHSSTRMLLHAVSLCSIAVAGCGGTPDAGAEAKVADRELPGIEAQVITMEPRDWPVTVRVHGSLVGDEVAVVGTKVSGRVAQVHVELGDPVKEGDPLITLDQEEFQLQVSQMEAQLGQAYAAVGLKMGDPLEKLNPENAPPVRRAKALWDEAKANLTRVRQLLSQTATSESEFERIATSERVAETQHASAINSVNEKIAEIRVRTAELGLARQRLEEAIVRAPFDGLIEERRVAPGSFVQAGQPIATVVSTNKLRFRATISERRAQRLAIGQEVRLHLGRGAEPRVLKVDRISPAIDELSRALVFEADVENRDRQLRSGRFAEAEVVLDAQAQSLVVPRSAVVEFAGVEKVWKVVDGVAQEQVVQTGQRRGDDIQITEGLANGEVILLDASQGRVGRVERLVQVKQPLNDLPDHSTSSARTAGE